MGAWVVLAHRPCSLGKKRRVGRTDHEVLEPAGEIDERVSVIENIAAVGKPVSEVSVCPQEGKKADGLNGEAREQDVNPLRNLRQCVSEQTFSWPAWKRTSVAVLAVAANPMPTD